MKTIRPILFLVTILSTATLYAQQVTVPFSTSAEPSFPAPALFQPVDKTTMLPADYLQFEWDFVSAPEGGVIYYDLYFGDSPNPPLYRENITEEWTSTDGYEFAFKDNYNDSYYLFYMNMFTTLHEETTYYWKVVAKNTQGESKSSETFSFTTARHNVLPTISELISPLNNATGIPKAVTLHWTASTDADGDKVTYNLYFGKNKSNIPLIQQGITANSYIIPYDLDDQETYYWKVQAIDGYSGQAATNNGTNDTWKFTIENYMADAPVAGILLTPKIGATNMSFNVNFTWTAASDKDNDQVTYDVYADTNPDPQTIIASGITTTSFPYIFSNYERYYWKVVVKDKGGLRDTSAIYSFTTWDGAPDFTIEMAIVEGGTFTMGQSDVKSVTNPYYINLEDEWPAHSVRLDNYRIAKLEITNEQYVRFLNSIVANTSIVTSIRAQGHFSFYYKNVAYNGKELCQVFDSLETGRPVGYEETYDSPIIWNGKQFKVDPKYKNHPVRFMFSYGAKLFASWLGNYRIPTEAEWEYAAMGGKLSKGYTYSGSNNYAEVAVQHVNGPIDVVKYTQPVGSLKPNELGIYDMSGNVEEICQDIYNAHFYTADNGVVYNPINTAFSGLEEVIRGGNFTSPQEIYVSVKKRYYLAWAQNINTSGIRLVGPEPNHYIISGAVIDSKGNAIQGVILSGFSSDKITGTDGYFSATELSGWTGTITIKAEGYSFSPDKFEITNLSGNLTNVNFVATPVITYYTISGKVITPSGTPLQNAIIKWETQSATTNANGEYTLTEAKGQAGYIAPQKEGYTFTPVKIDIASLQGNLSGNDFIAIPVVKYHTVSGTVTDLEGNPLPNIGINGFSVNIMTDGNGTFFSSEQEGWSGNITPSSGGYTFNPLSWSISDLQKDSTVHFAARLVTSVSNAAMDRECRVFPNPSSNGVFQIQFPENRAYVQIYDLLGNLVFENVINNHSDIRLLNKGVFIVNIRTENNSFTKKVVIE